MPSENAQTLSRQRVLDRARALSNMTVDRGCSEPEAETCQRLLQALIRTYGFTTDELATGHPDLPWEDDGQRAGSRQLGEKPLFRDDGYRSGKSWLDRGGRRVIAVEEMGEIQLRQGIEMFQRRLADREYSHKWIEYDLRLGWLIDECFRRGCALPNVSFEPTVV